jgi:hypothetical protein
MEELFKGLPRPRMVNGIKIWPASFHGDDKFFIAYEGNPYYFRSYGNAITWIKNNVNSQGSS